MARRRSGKWLAKAVLAGQWDCDTALAQHLHDNYRGPLDIPTFSKVHVALCCANRGWRDRVLDLPDVTPRWS